MSDLDSVIIKAEIEEELEKIVDDAIEEIETDEKLKAESEKSQNIEKFKEYLEIQKMILTNRNEILENRTVSNKSESKILEVAEKNNKVITSVDNKFNKVMYALFTIFFLLGVIIGLNGDIWTPYISDILNFTRASTNIMRG
jgi:hypothetical protein